MSAWTLTAFLALLAVVNPPKEPPQPAGVRIDQSDAFLVPPPKLKDAADFVVAKRPPKILFCPVESLPPLPEGKGLWSSWGQGILASNGKYYVGVGNHLGVDGNALLYEFDPQTGRQRVVLNLAEVLGLRPGEWGHGKLHGRLDELDDGRLVFATYWGEHPGENIRPEARRQIGGRLLTYNIHTGRVEDLGMPLGGDAWPMHATDTKRKRFFAIGVYSNFLVYDLAERRCLYAGTLPPGVDWDERVTLVDEATGACYGSDSSSIFRFDPRAGVFCIKPGLMPRHPWTGQPTRPIRCYTRRRCKDGAFYVQTYDGVLFRFYPDRWCVEPIGLNWGQGTYSPAMALSPDERYLYYSVDAHGNAFVHGSPVVQYDLQTNSRKVIAFLHPYYAEKYGYVFGGSYSIAISPDASKLVICWNGRFRAPGDQGESFGQPSFMVIHIPACERGASPSGSPRSW